MHQSDITKLRELWDEVKAVILHVDERLLKSFEEEMV